MRSFQNIIFSSSKVCDRVQVHIYGTKDGEIYFVGSFYADNYKEACKKAQEYKDNFARGLL